MSTTRWQSTADPAATYRVTEALGAGGQGTVSRVVREGDGAVFVLKTLHLATAVAGAGGEDVWKQAERLAREADVLAGLSHPGLPRLVDRVRSEAGEDGFIQTLVDGEPLAALTARAGRLDAARFTRLTRELLALLAYLHGQRPPVVHRDISPRNVLLGPGPEGRASLIDFGAVRFPGEGLGPQVTTAGTFGTMAPEQMMGQAVPASDLYALGVTLVSLASGRAPTELPVEGATGAIDVRAVVSLPEPLPTLLTRLTRVALADRLATAEEALALLDGPAVTAPMERVPPGPTGPARAAGPRVSRGPARGLAFLRRHALWLAPTALLLGGWAVSVWPRAGQVAQLGGWFSGHGSMAGKMTGTWLGDPALISSGTHLGPFAWSMAPEGGLLASTDRGEVRLWDVANAQQVAYLEVPGDFRPFVRHMAISADGRVLLAATEALVVAWERDAGGAPRELGRWPLPPRDDAPLVGLAARSPTDLRWVLLRDRALVIASLGAAGAGGPGAARPDAGAVATVAEVPVARGLTPGLARVSADGRTLAFAAGDALYRHAMADGAPIDVTPLGPSATPRDTLALDATGATFALGYPDLVEVWDVAAGPREATPRATVRLDLLTHFDAPDQLALSPDGGLLAFGEGPAVRLVDARSGAERARFEGGHAGFIGPVAFSPDGASLAASASDGVIRVWRATP